MSLSLNLWFSDGNIIKRERFCANDDCEGSPVEVDQSSGLECSENDKVILKWSKWRLGECSRPCGGGNWIHTRECLQPPCAGESKKITNYKCNTQKCHLNLKICSKPCGGGLYSIKKQCLEYDEGTLDSVVMISLH